MRKTFDAGYRFAIEGYRRFVNHPDGRQMAWSVSDQFMVSGLNFIIGILAAKILGVAGFGQFTLVMVLAALATVLHHDGLTAPTMTLVGGQSRRSKSYFAAVVFSGLWLSLLLALIVAALVAGVYGLREEPLPMRLVAAAFLITLFQTNHGCVRRLAFAQTRGLAAFLLDLSRFAMVAIGIVWLWLSGTEIDATGLLLLFALAALVSALPLNIEILRAPIRRKLLAQVWARHWPMSRWLVLMVIVSMGQEQIIYLIMGIMLGDEGVGGLRAGQHLLGVTHFLLMAMENFIPRQAAERFSQGGHEALRGYLTRQTFVIGSVTLGLVLALVIPARFWMGTVYGADYLPYVPVLVIYGLAYLAIFLRDLWVIYLRAIEQTQCIFRAFATSSLMAIVAAYPAMLYAGVIGAALVVMAAHMISMVYIGYEVRRFYRAGIARQQHN